MRVRWTGNESCVCGGSLREPGAEYDLDDAIVGDLLARGLVAECTETATPVEPPKASGKVSKALPAGEEN